MNYSREIAEKLLEIKAVTVVNKENLFTWASGIKSPIYCDNRITISYPEVRKLIANAFVDKLRKEYPEVEYLAGAATGGIPHAAWVADDMELPMVYVRSSAKGHGKTNQVEGRIPEGAKAVVIEDLFSTGGSSMKVVEALRDAGVEVIGCVSIFSYNFPIVGEIFDKADVKYDSLTNYDILLPIALDKGYISENDLEELKAWSKNPRMFTE